MRSELIELAGKYRALLEVPLRPETDEEADVGSRREATLAMCLAGHHVDCSCERTGFSARRSL